MASTDDNPPAALLRNLVVPVAGAEDATATARALDPYSPGSITVVYVVEKGEGVPDKTPVSQSESVASDAIEVFKSAFPDAESEVLYDRDVVDAVLAFADETDASAIAFRPRGGSRVTQFLAGDKALRLVTEADQPVLSLPDRDAST